MTTPKKTFDSIQIKRDAQESIYQTIKQMTPQEEIDYFRKSVQRSKLSKWWESVSSRTEISEMR